MHELKRVLYKFLANAEDSLTTEQESILLYFVDYASGELKHKIVADPVMYESRGQCLPKTTPTPMPYYSGDAIIHKDGKYHVSVNIQDGTERCGVYEDLRVAQQAWVDSQKCLNNNDFTIKDAPKPVYIEPMYQIVSR